MDASLIGATMSVETGMLQLAVAARLAQMSAVASSSVAELAAQQNFDPLANITAGIGTNLDVIV